MSYPLSWLSCKSQSRTSQWFQESARPLNPKKCSAHAVVLAQVEVLKRHLRSLFVQSEGSCIPAVFSPRTRRRTCFFFCYSFQSKLSKNHAKPSAGHSFAPYAHCYFVKNCTEAPGWLQPFCWGCHKQNCIEHVFPFRSHVAGSNPEFFCMRGRYRWKHAR